MIRVEMSRQDWDTVVMSLRHLMHTQFPSLGPVYSTLVEQLDEEHEVP